ncbi:MAG: hypothetical protein KKF46_00290 [Nanoarchaeota archaeon]|nr:hypothetical protein [Nanoarchaeota archaeon]MBU1320772.1 hypothetical protein [Nanoarchaeota archaeon]MBU1598139.1 hypothetical protein [Nanoarchaeota archaeon]MBU2442200.1 hypothetical protein [Nanoarchaeota archaeon]
MAGKNDLFQEVKFELLKVVLINTFLDALMVFFVAYFIVSFINIKFLYTLLIPAVITFVFFFVMILLRIKKLKLKAMEDANPQVKEMLRTAHDNMNQDNIMTMALFEDLKQKMKTVSTGNLLESKKIIIRIVSAVILVFLIIFVSSFNININKIDIPFEKLKFMIQSGNNDLADGSITDLVFNETEVVYGDASIAKLGNEEIDLNMNPSMSEIDFNEIGDSERQDLREGGIPQEIGINPDAFSNQEMLDEAEQAANYSQRIKNI